MKKKYVYIGCFTQAQALYTATDGIRRIRHSREIEYPHVTFRYRPDNVDTALFGTPITVKITGYGCDDKNEGVRVELRTENAAVQAMIDGIDTPHITLSVAENGEPVDTRRLLFEPTEPIYVDGVFGAYTAQGPVLCSTSYETE